METHNRIVRAGSAWLLAACIAMFAALVSLPTPAQAQRMPCDRVPFAAFYAASVEGVSADSLTACLVGTTQPTNRVFTSWQDAPRLLRHLREIDGRLRSGVTRESIPSPADVALANFAALHARCEDPQDNEVDAGATDAATDAEEADGGTEASDAEVINASDDVPVTHHHRHRVRLSRTAIQRHPWNPSAWFPESECTGGRSIEIRPADARMVSRIVRNDVFVADATRRLADPIQDRSQVPALVAGLRQRLADPTGDPIPASLFPSLASACLTTVASLPSTCFTADANAAGTPGMDASLTAGERRELDRLRRRVRSLDGANGALRGENRDLRSRLELLKELPTYLAIAIAVLLVLFFFGFLPWAVGSINKFKKRCRELRAELGRTEDAGSYNKGLADGQQRVFELATQTGEVMLPSSGLQPLVLKGTAEAMVGRIAALTSIIEGLSWSILHLFPEDDERRNPVFTDRPTPEELGHLVQQSFTDAVAARDALVLKTTKRAHTELLARYNEEIQHLRAEAVHRDSALDLLAEEIRDLFPKDQKPEWDGFVGEPTPLMKADAAMGMFNPALAARDELAQQPYRDLAVSVRALAQRTSEDLEPESAQHELLTNPDGDPIDQVYNVSLALFDLRDRMSSAVEAAQRLVSKIDGSIRERNSLMGGLLTEETVIRPSPFAAPHLGLAPLLDRLENRLDCLLALDAPEATGEHLAGTVGRSRMHHRSGTLKMFAAPPPRETSSPPPDAEGGGEKQGE